MNWILEMLFAVLCVLALTLLWLVWWSRRQERKVAPPLHEVLPDGIAPQPRMLLYFYSEHCGACRAVTPLIEALGQERTGVVKVDVRRHIETARRFDIVRTPSLVLVDEGRIAGVHVGAISDSKLLHFYDGRRG